MPTYVMRKGKLIKATTLMKRALRSHPGGKVSWPLLSRGAGVHLSQIDEMERLYPGHKFDRKTGRAIFDSSSHRRQCLRDRGFVDLDGNRSGRNV